MSKDGSFLVVWNSVWNRNDFSSFDFRLLSNTPLYGINRGQDKSLSSSVCNFIGNIFPYHARGNSTLTYPQIFKANVKLHMTCPCERRHTLAWNSSCSFHPNGKRISSLTLFPLSLGQSFTFRSNWTRPRVFHVWKSPGNPFRWNLRLSVA